MVRRIESRFASAALLLLLFLVVFYGCRAFDPEPIIVNIPPDTFITGAPAETTGTVFNRHMYWYGNDVDGEVVKFIFAITDSTVRDETQPNVDEEDVRFDPADDALTLRQTDGRIVGYTTKTDSVFVFTIDRESNTSKDITFHIVAVDDRGAIDPTPARLHFFNNSLGNPVIRFSVTTIDESGQETERWVGTTDGPKLSGDTIWPWAPDPNVISPESTDEPYIGFANHFRICWEASSPNGAITGYRYKASDIQNARFYPTTYDPDLGREVESWGLDTTCFDYQNDENIDPNNLPSGCNSGWGDCPELRMWDSGFHLLKVVALDEALVQSTALSGELRFNVNYPPETELIRDSQWPRYTTDGVNWLNFSEGDTVPDKSYVQFKQRGVDRFERNRNDPLLAGLPCCDYPNVSSNPDSEVSYQTRIEEARAVNDRGANFYWKSSYSPAERPDTLGFHVGPFDYSMSFRTEDELLRKDPSPPTFSFVAGFIPILSSVSPGNADSLVIKEPAFATQRWPANTVDYTVNLDNPPEGTVRYWDGSKYVFSATKEDDSWRAIQGNIIRFSVRFEGRPDAREPEGSLESWTYQLNSENDPLNQTKEGAGRDVFGRWESPGTSNFWEMSAGVPGKGVEIFVPQLLWRAPQLFAKGTDTTSEGQFYKLGVVLARQLGHLHLRVQGKTTKVGQVFQYCYLRVRESCGSNTVDIPMSDKGRRSKIVETVFPAYLGLDPGGTGVITQLWPPDDYMPDN